MTTTYIAVGPSDELAVRGSRDGEVVFLSLGDGVTVALSPAQWERLRALGGERS